METNEIKRIEVVGVPRIPQLRAKETKEVIVQRPIRTTTLRVLKDAGITVAKFRSMAQRTRLRSEKDVELVRKHIILWRKYRWL